ncbi:MAG: response regulator [Breznakibacter sp.]
MRNWFDSLSTIQRNANRLKHLLHQVIDIRRIDAEKLDYNPAPTNVIQNLHDLFACFSIEAREREIDFQFISESNEFEANIDPDKFDKIVFNLLSNAFKFVPEHGKVIVSLSKDSIRKNYTLGSEIHDDYMEINISNTGSYIPASEHKQIFERFFQGKENNKHGTGIGLHMVNEYVSLHSGQIDVQSSENNGTSFIVRIPFSRGAMASNATETIGSQKNQTEFRPILPEQAIINDGKRNLILVVEDNPELRSFLRKSLSHTYTVVTAPNGQKGFEQAIDINPDLIISDIMMPIMDGLELCKKLKLDENTNHIPVILLTALSSETHQIEGLMTGADAYIPKPFNENLLHTQIQTLLLNRQILKERFLDPESPLGDNNADIQDTAFITKAITIVEEHLLDQNFNVEVLADKLRVSRTSLHRKLRAHTDQSATEFIRFVRLKKALKLLKTGNYTIDEISYNVGFNTPSYFSQSFKKQFGKTPKEYLGLKD